MTVWIRIADARFQARHGALPHEGQVWQEFAVDCRLRVETAATTSDALADTVDYGKAYAVVREIMEGPSYQLLEGLAGAIAERLLHFPRVRAVRVAVRKLAPPLPGVVGHVEVEVSAPE